MAGYPRVVGGHYYPGTGVQGGYVAGYDQWGRGVDQYGQVVGAAPAAPPPPMLMAPHPSMMQVHPAGPPNIQAPPWRPMVAPGSPPLGEGHVPIPLTAETFGGTWGGAAGGPAGSVIIFSARPQKPFKTARLIVRGTKSGPTAIGNLIGQTFIGTSLQQGELGFIDLESIGAANAFDTWVSMHQAEPGVWIRVQATLTAFPTAPDFEVYTLTALGHYLH